MRPDHVDVAGHPFRIVWHHEHLLDEEGEQLTGKMELASSTIRVLASDESSEYNQRDSLLHEVIHAELSIASCGSKATDTWRSEDAYERVVNVLSTLLLDTFRRNPALVAYLTEPLT